MHTLWLLPDCHGMKGVNDLRECCYRKWINHNTLTLITSLEQHNTECFIPHAVFYSLLWRNPWQKLRMRTTGLQVSLTGTNRGRGTSGSADDNVIDWQVSPGSWWSTFCFTEPVEGNKDSSLSSEQTFCWIGSYVRGNFPRYFTESGAVLKSLMAPLNKQK